MTLRRMVNDSVHWHMQDLTSRIIAKSGISSDRFHIGKMILQGLKDAPEFILQIDGAKGESETCGSVLERSVRCAKNLRSLGFGKGDVMVLIAPNHLDVCVPLYAAFYLGITVASLDKTFKIHEFQYVFNILKPAIIFCQDDVASNAQLSLFNLNMNAHIITFDKGDYFCNFTDFMEQYGDETPTEDFTCADFDPENTISFITMTSGTTGVPKAIAHSHKYIAMIIPYIWQRANTFPVPTRLALIGSPLLWSTAMTSFIRSPILRYTRLQSSRCLTTEHTYYLINTYRPSYMIISPTSMTSLMKPEIRSNCDFKSFDLIMLTGSYVQQSLMDDLKLVAPKTEVLNIFGMSELGGLAFLGDNPAPGSCGKPMGCFQYRIINVNTQEDIYDANVEGELWLKGPCPFMGFYNDEANTKEYITKDGWMKTGDIFYRDEEYNFFYVYRLKLQLKCLNKRISPLEIEGVIRQHPGVLDVVVTSVPCDERGDLPTACIVPRPGAKPSAEEIKNLVKDSMIDASRLRGGVIFLDAMPMTATTKIHRSKIKQMVLELPRV